MVLSDPIYLLFLLLVAAVAHYLPERFKLAFVLGVSGAFYLLQGPHWYVLLWVTCIGFLGGCVVAALPEGRLRLSTLAAAITLLLLPLLFFKYFVNAAGVSAILHTASFSAAQLALPIGLSFFSFTTIGYLIDVYLETIPAEKSVGRFALFTSFFPQVTQGPIGRATALLPQLSNVGRFQYDKCVAGLRLILLGLFLKIAVADALGPQVDVVYATPTKYGAADQILATVYFAYQVYADFAGYSLIAIGSGKILGVELLTNFAQPYLSQSVAEYWRRWHTSLSSWFGNYAFVPLQAQLRRLGTLSIAIALMATFVLVGIWHGAGAKFAIFGGIHGCLVATSTLTLKARTVWWRRIGIPGPVVASVRTIATFAIVTSTLVLFRAGTLSDAKFMYRTMAAFDSASITLPMLRPLAVIAGTIAIDLAARRKLDLKQWPPVLRWSLYYLAVVLISVSFIWNADESSVYARQFIYFKF